jgi:hypothetical protein
MDARSRRRPQRGDRFHRGSGITGNPVTFTAADPAVPFRRSSHSDDPNRGSRTGGGMAPSVIVRDANQEPFVGAVVVFAVIEGGGLVTGASQTTDANGRATADSWTLGLVPGNNTLTATVAGAGITGNPVTFSATATAPGPATITPVSPIVQSAPQGEALGSAFGHRPRRPPPSRLRRSQWSSRSRRAVDESPAGLRPPTPMERQPFSPGPWVRRPAPIPSRRK